MKPNKPLQLLLLAAFLAIPAGVVRAAAPVPPARPNIVLIFMDDLGYGDIGPFGSKLNRTPALDRMASEGTKLTSFYASPVCSVSRAQVMTGCYGPRVSLPGVLYPGQAIGISAEEHTVAELMRAQGYATMCIGKWHLGDSPEFLPTRHGFDHYFGIPYSNDMMKPRAGTTNRVVPLVRDEKVVELLDGAAQENLVRDYTAEAVNFIHANRQKPFFLYLPHTAVHTPVHPGKEFRGKSANGQFGDWVEETDWSVGRVLHTLRELKLAANTLVIFTSDNGPWLSQGKDGGTAGPLRGGKGSTWEGGVRVPTIAWWPGKVPAGRATDTVAGTIDLLPTFVTLAGGVVPADKPIDGADISKLLFGQTEEAAREAHYFYNNYDLQAVRSGPWKLALVPQKFAMGVKDDAIRFAENRPGLRLYNLAADIGESKNVAAENPEVVARLKALADKMAATLCDGSAKGPGVRPPGRVENPKGLYPMTSTKPKVKSP